MKTNSYTYENIETNLKKKFQLDGLLGKSGQIVLSLVEEVRYPDTGNARMITKLKTNVVWHTKFLAMERRLKKKLEFVILDLAAVVELVLLFLILLLPQLVKIFKNVYLPQK